MGYEWQFKNSWAERFNVRNANAIKRTVQVAILETKIDNLFLKYKPELLLLIDTVILNHSFITNK